MARAGFGEPAEVDAGTAAGTVGAYQWLLARVGDRGITLTQAGYLPTAVVREAFAALDLGDEPPGPMNEARIYPVHEFRESARQLGLVRKHRGRLLLTARGRSLADEPVGLWHHLAARLPAGDDDAERQTGLVSLLFTAASDGTESAAGPDLVDAVAEVLSSIGWIGADGRPFDRRLALEAARPTNGVLHYLGILPGSFRQPTVPTPQGRAFARDALASGT